MSVRGPVELSRLLVVPLLVLSAPESGQSTEAFWNDASVSNRRVQHCDVASCTPADFAPGLAPTLQGDIAIDPVEGMVYWAVVGSVVNTTKIQRKSLAGGPVEDIFDLSSVPASNISGMAVDPVARHVYVATPGTATRIRRFSIDSPAGTGVVVVAFNEASCPCSPQGLALDLVNGFLYFSDQGNNRVARKALDLASPIEDVVTGVSQPSALALDLAHDRVYFSQTSPSRVTYALLSNPAVRVDLVNPVANPLNAGGLEIDPTQGTLGELYIAITGTQEVRHCSLDAGCPLPLVLLASGMSNNSALALLLASPVPWLGGVGACLLAALIAVLAWAPGRPGGARDRG